MIVLLGFVTADPCFDKAVKCPQFRAACSAQYADHLKQQCPNTCDVCKYKPGGKNERKFAARFLEIDFGFGLANATDQEAINRIQKCCQTNGMTASCQPYCRYNTTREEVYILV